MGFIQSGGILLSILFVKAQNLILDFQTRKGIRYAKEQENLNLCHCSSTDSETFIQMQLTEWILCKKENIR